MHISDATMKQLLLIFFFSLPLFSAGQNWSPTGATWYYGFSAWTTDGYCKIEYVGDTTISSIQCKKLLKKMVWYESGFMTSGSVVLGTEYTYADSNKVYIYKHNQFYTLYDFSAIVGATWIVPEVKNYPGCDTVGTIRVDSIGTTLINSQTLRYICVSLINTTQKWGWNAKIVERIGPIKPLLPTWSAGNYDYLFPVKFDHCGMVSDELVEGGNFRCYSDSSFSYSSNITPTCDYIASDNLADINFFQLIAFPNPTTGKFLIKTQEKIEKIKIYNALGEIIIKSDISDSEIDLTKQPAGIYFLSARTKDKIILRKILKE